MAEFADVDQWQEMIGREGGEVAIAKRINALSDEELLEAFEVLSDETIIQKSTTLTAIEKVMIQRGLRPPDNQSRRIVSGST